MLDNVDYTYERDLKTFLKKDGVLCIQDPSLNLDSYSNTYCGSNMILLSYLDSLAPLGYNVKVYDSIDEYRSDFEEIGLSDIGCKECGVYLISDKHIKEELKSIEDIGRVLGIKDKRNV